MIGPKLQPRGGSSASRSGTAPFHARNLVQFCPFADSVARFTMDYTPPGERAEHVLYYSYVDLLAMGIVCVMPFFLLLGVPVSLLLDSILYKMRPSGRFRKYALAVLVYTLGGVMVTLLLPLVIRGGFAESWDALRNMLLSVVFASLLFCMLPCCRMGCGRS